MVRTIWQVELVLKEEAKGGESPQGKIETLSSEPSSAELSGSNLGSSDATSPQDERLPSSDATSPQDDRFEETYLELRKWVDISSTKYSLLTVIRERRAGRLGTAMKVQKGRFFQKEI